MFILDGMSIKTLLSTGEGTYLDINLEFKVIFLD